MPILKWTALPRTQIVTSESIILVGPTVNMLPNIVFSINRKKTGKEKHAWHTVAVVPGLPTNGTIRGGGWVTDLLGKSDEVLVVGVHVS